MALATEDDVEAALGRSLTSTEDVTVLLEVASDEVNGYLGWVIPAEIPAVVARVVAEMVAAVLLKPQTVVADYGAGGYNQIREAATVHVGAEPQTTLGTWLTASQKRRLAPYHRGGITSIPLVSERT